MAVSAPSRGSILPPKGLLIALVTQLPLALADLPLRPSAVEITTGILLLLAGLAINVWAERQFRHVGVGVCPFSPTHVVVTTGPYRFTRNPMYVGLVALCLSSVLLTGVPLNAWTAVAYAIWLHRRFILPEEQFLLRERGRVLRRLSAPGSSMAQVAARIVVSESGRSWRVSKSGCDWHWGFGNVPAGTFCSS